jgi:anti-sigma factor RsiW
MSWRRKSSNRTDHGYVEERLSAYLDGELSPREQQTVDRHLATCPACRWQLDTLRQTVQWTQELPTIPVPRVFTVPAPAQAVPAPRRGWGFVPLLQGATALVALLLFFVIAGDFAFSGILGGRALQPAVLREQAPAATGIAAATRLVKATRIVEVVKEVEAEAVVEEVEAEVVMDEAALEPASTPLPQVAAPTEAPPPESADRVQMEKAAVAPTPSPEIRAMQTLGFEAPVEKEAEAVAEGEAAEAPLAPALETTAAADAIAAAVEPTPAVMATVVPTEPTVVVAPTAVAEAHPAPEVGARKPTGAVSQAGDQRQALVVRQRGADWLRAAELGLAAVLVMLGIVTITAMVLRRRAG